MDVTAIGVPIHSIELGQMTRGSAEEQFSAAMTRATISQPDDAVAARLAIRAFDTSRTADASSMAIYAEGARQVSIAQGLPGGSYDFTRITPRQMTIVGGALVSRGTVSAAGLAGALDLASQVAEPDTPVNFFAYLNQQAKVNEGISGGMPTAFQQKASLSVLTRIQAERGVPIVYDDNYPTAPHAPTAEEINTKMKEAIAAFTKEASLTPAQRIRRDVLKDMKITEDDLKAMPQAERVAAEKKIGEEIARRLTKLGLAEGDSRQQPDGASMSALSKVA